MPTILRILIRAGQQWSANEDSRQGAALAYYALFSIAPLLVIAVAIAGAVFGDEAARGEVSHALDQYVGAESAKAIEGLVENAGRSYETIWMSVVSIGVLLFGALGAFLQLRGALAIIWKFTPPRGNSYLGMLLDYSLALVMVLFTGLLLLVSLVASICVRAIRAYMDENFPFEAIPWATTLELASSLVFLTLLFAMIYRTLSGQRIAWRYVLYGSVFAALLFTVGKTLLSLYLVYTGTASSYGAAGSIVVFLMWVYYSSQILFFCAELIQAGRTRDVWMAAEAALEKKEP